MKHYLIDLKDLAHAKVSLQDTCDPGVVDFSADGVRQVAPLVWSATVERAGFEIRISGSLRTSVELACSRCLEPAACEIRKTFDLFFRERDRRMFDEDDEIELTERDTRTAFFSGTQLDIGDVLREQVLLALPMKPLCRADCQGLCGSCGANLNIQTCECPAQQFSSHADTLREIKRTLEERSS